MGKSAKAKAAKPAKKSTTTKHKKVTKSASGGAAMTILNLVAGLKVTMKQDSVDRDKLPHLTGGLGKSTIANAITKFKNEGWMIVTPKTLSITDKGMENADQEEMTRLLADTPKTNKEFWAKVPEQFGLKNKHVKVFEALQDGRTHPKMDIIMAVFGKSNSTSSNALTDLKKCDVVEFDSKTIRLTDKMFPFESRPKV